MKFKLYIEYNGANYSGWQKQGNAKSIQETLDKFHQRSIQKN